jgi:hypothetical protein
MLAAVVLKRGQSLLDANLPGDAERDRLLGNTPGLFATLFDQVRLNLACGSSVKSAEPIAEAFSGDVLAYHAAASTSVAATSSMSIATVLPVIRRLGSATKRTAAHSLIDAGSMPDRRIMSAET